MVAMKHSPQNLPKAQQASTPKLHWGITDKFTFTFIYLSSFSSGTHASGYADKKANQQSTPVTAKQQTHSQITSQQNKKCADKPQSVTYHSERRQEMNFNETI